MSKKNEDKIVLERYAMWNPDVQKSGDACQLCSPCGGGCGLDGG